MLLVFKERDVTLSVTCADQLKILRELAIRIKHCGKGDTLKQVEEFELASNLLAEEVLQLIDRRG